MVNKKGMLLASETLKMVLALISIGFLIYLLAAIYFSSISNDEKLQAESTIDRLGKVIAKISSNSSYVETMTEVVPAAWRFFSYTGNERKPNSCLNQNCICICDEVFIDNLIFVKNRQINECSNDGVCLVVGNLKEFNDFDIGVIPNSIEIKEENGEVVITKK